MVHIIRYLGWVDAPRLSQICVLCLDFRSFLPVESKLLPGKMTPTSVSSDYDFLLECPTVMEAVCCFYSWVKMWWAFSFPLFMAPLSLSDCNADSLPLAFSEPPPEITVHFLLHIHISIITMALPLWEMESLVV